jgi:16S rRNA (uracil1498-N3)-methyltransferase
VNLILLDAGEVAADGTATLDDARAAHIAGVLGGQPGRTVRIGVIDGPLGTGTLTSVTQTHVTLTCALEPAAPPLPDLDLLLALPRPKVLRRLWAQLAALGVHRIMLTNAERVERNYFDTHLLEERTYRPLLVEGLQQARDTRLPVVSVHRQLKVLVEDHLDGLCADSRRIVAYHRAALPVVEAIRQHSGRVLLAVGPEGGWNDYELALLQSHRFTPVSMGPRTLRVDTACIALIAAASTVQR